MMEKDILEQSFISGWMAAATAYGGPAEDNEEESAKEAFNEWMLENG